MKDDASKLESLEYLDAISKLIEDHLQEHLRCPATDFATLAYEKLQNHWLPLLKSFKHHWQMRDKLRDAFTADIEKPLVNRTYLCVDFEDCCFPNDFRIFLRFGMTSAILVGAFLERAKSGLENVVW